MSQKVTCPRCGQAAEYSDDNPFRPFCSKRCKESDLYKWLVEDDDANKDDANGDDPERETPLLH